jgi:hypothetical protein
MAPANASRLPAGADGSAMRRESSHAIRPGGDAPFVIASRDAWPEAWAPVQPVFWRPWIPNATSVISLCWSSGSLAPNSRHHATQATTWSSHAARCSIE